MQLQVDEGVLTAKEASIHPGKSTLVRVIGTDFIVPCDILEGAVRNGDIFLLCSDGLTDMVADPVIKDLLDSAGSLEHKTSSLISAALAAGGRGNVTVVICQLAMATGHEQVGLDVADAAPIWPSRPPAPRQ